MTVLLCISASEEEAQRLIAGGPRRDFVELQRATGGEIVYSGGAKRRGLLGRFFGPHIWQAWRAAARTHDGDIVYADGEHIAVPLLFFLALRRRKPERVVFIGDTLWLWKRLLLWMVTRLGIPGRVIVHSVVQGRLISSWLHRSWDLVLLPYQVDPDFWAPSGPPPQNGQAPLVLAVGSEYRDYGTLARAVAGLPVRVVIAGGSHWARDLSTAGELPDNVEFLSRPLGFPELRERYQEAAVVVVPVQPIDNQTGVTAMFEAMSMARPLVVTATRGQRECVRGPLVRPDGGLDSEATAGRGPQLFDRSAADDEHPTALYVPEQDPRALRAAVSMLVEDEQLAGALGNAARESVRRHFTVDHFASRFAAAILAPEPPIETLVAPRWDR